MVTTYSVWMRAQTLAVKTLHNLPDHASLICN